MKMNVGGGGGLLLRFIRGHDFLMLLFGIVNFGILRYSNETLTTSETPLYSCKPLILSFTCYTSG